MGEERSISLRSQNFDSKAQAYLHSRKYHVFVLIVLPFLLSAGWGMTSCFQPITEVDTEFHSSPRHYLQLIAEAQQDWNGQEDSLSTQLERQPRTRRAVERVGGRGLGIQRVCGEVQSILPRADSRKAKPWQGLHIEGPRNPERTLEIMEATNSRQKQGVR